MLATWTTSRGTDFLTGRPSLTVIVDSTAAFLATLYNQHLVIGSRTAPVEEVITHEENGLLVDFFSPQELVEAIQRACEDPARMRAIRERARETILSQYDLRSVCLPRQKALIESPVHHEEQSVSVARISNNRVIADLAGN